MDAFAWIIVIAVIIIALTGGWGYYGGGGWGGPNYSGRNYGPGLGILGTLLVVALVVWVVLHLA